MYFLEKLQSNETKELSETEKNPSSDLLSNTAEQTTDDFPKVSIKEEPIESFSEKLENYSNLNIKQEKNFDPFEPEPVSIIKEEPMEIDPTSSLMTIWNEDLHPQNLLETYSQLTDYQDFLIKNQNSLNLNNVNQNKGKSTGKSKSYSCAMCLKFFDFKADFNFHFQKHHKSSSANTSKYFVNPPQTSKAQVKLKYNCPVEHCAMAFKFKSDCIAHARQFHPQKIKDVDKLEKVDSKCSKNESKFCCILCQKMYKFKSDCMAHISSQHNLKKDEVETFVHYKCIVCFEFFSHKDFYNQHMAIHYQAKGSK